MGERLLWVTIAVNHLLGKPVSALLEALHIHPANPEYPIPNHVVLQIVVFALAAVFFLWLKGANFGGPPRRHAASAWKRC